MSVFDDSRLRRLQQDLENLLEGQTLMIREMASLRQTMEREIARKRDYYEGEIDSIERRRKAAESRIPDVQRQIEKRQQEITKEMEAQRKAA